MLLTFVALHRVQYLVLSRDHHQKQMRLLIVVVLAAFLNMLCSLRYGIYIFFGFWQFVAIIFTYFLVPETRGVAIEEVTPPPPTHPSLQPTCPS